MGEMPLFFQEEMYHITPKSLFENPGGVGRAGLMNS